MIDLQPTPEQQPQEHEINGEMIDNIRALWSDYTLATLSGMIQDRHEQLGVIVRLFSAMEDNMRQLVSGIEMQGKSVISMLENHTPTEEDRKILKRRTRAQTRSAKGMLNLFAEGKKLLGGLLKDVDKMIPPIELLLKHYPNKHRPPNCLIFTLLTSLFA